MSRRDGSGLPAMTTTPRTELDQRYSSPDAPATSWADAQRLLLATEVFWVGTVRPDGRPHTTPLIAVWYGDALHFCTGVGEQKWRNLQSDARCLLTTGDGAPTDVVVEGEASRVTDEERLRELAAAWWDRHGEPWRFEVADGAFHGGGGNGAPAHVFAVRPVVAYAYRKEDPFAMTRFTFHDG